MDIKDYLTEAEILGKYATEGDAKADMLRIYDALKKGERVLALGEKA